MSITYETVPQIHATIPVGQVISQDPPEGTIIDPNIDTTVRIYVSSGPGYAKYAGFSVSANVAVFSVS